MVSPGHLDHNGNTAYLREKYGARIAVHAGDSMMTESGDMFSGVKSFTVAIIRVFLPLIGMSRYDSYRPDITLEDGHDLSEHGFDARVIHIPGHSKGSIGARAAIKPHQNCKRAGNHRNSSREAGKYVNKR